MYTKVSDWFIWIVIAEKSCRPLRRWHQIEFLIEQKNLVRFFYASNIIYKSKDGHITEERYALFIITGDIND